MKYLYLILCCFSIAINAQEKKYYNIYLDESNNPIDISEYYKKCNSFLFHCMNKTRDSITINNMYEIKKFGQLDSIQNNQIKQLLKRDTKNNTATNKPIIIVFRDTLFSFEAYENRYKNYVDKISINDTVAEFPEFKLTKSKYLSARKNYDVHQKKCKKTFKNINYSTIYLFSQNRGYSYQSKNFKWKKISTPIYHKFFKNRYSTSVILKPNGQYFIYDYLNDKYLKKMLKESWDPYINDYLSAKKRLAQKPFGFFIDSKPEWQTNRTFYYTTYSAGHRKSTGYSKKPNFRPQNVPYNAIRVNNRSEISAYLNSSNSCYSIKGF